MLPVKNHRADGHFNDHVVRTRPVTLGTGTLLAARRIPRSPLGQVDEAVHVGCRAENDAPPLAPVAAVRPTARYVLFTPETDAAVASFSGLNLNFNFVYEHQKMWGIKGREILLTRPAHTTYVGRGSLWPSILHENWHNSRACRQNPL